MREITKLMVNDFNLKKLGYDFAGFHFNKTNELSFHHLIVPHRDSKEYGIGEGYVYWNGAILVQNTSHDYLHLIERINRPMFLAITDELVKENKQGYVDINNIRCIHNVMEEFEDKYGDIRGKKGICKKSHKILKNMLTFFFIICYNVFVSTEVLIQVIKNIS